MRTKRLLSWLFALLPLLITLFVLPVLPDTIPVHYDIGGEVTRYGSKYEVLILPLITPFMGLFWLLMERIISRDKEKGTQNVKLLFWINISVTLIFTVIQIWILHLAYTNAETIVNVDFNSIKVLSVCLSVVWIIIGNLLPKCKQNYILGIRTTWTLKNEVSWYKTHRFGGKVFFIYGVISALTCLFIFNGYIGLLVSVGGLCVVTIPIIAYSYRIYKQEMK